MKNQFGNTIVVFFKRFSIAIILLTSIIVVFKNKFILINNYLKDISYITSFMSFLFAVLALLIASLAYENSNKKPHLKLEKFTWDEGGSHLFLNVDKENNKVVMARPGAEWYFTLVNKGEKSAKFPVVQITFNEMYFSIDTFNGWTPIKHANGFGYFGFQWDPGESVVVHPNLPIRLPPMHLAGSPVLGDELQLDIEIAADEFDVVKITEMVELRCC